MEVTVSEVKSKLSSLLSYVEKGQELIVMRRGKEVARIVPPAKKHKPLPSLKDFRESIRISGESLSATVVRMRNQERF